ncbi:MAG TPA: HAMP domain-containing sensor histidine kinase [Bacteroidia bacterium]|nr:HAMP domain-containing sensor histidine kinase [Bacteroidia bacterium]
MQIRTRLTLQFTGLVAVIFLISYFIIYYSQAQFRISQFNDRLRDKARTTAELLISVDAVTPELLKIIDRNRKDVLYKENISVYNRLNEEIYTSNDTTDFNVTPVMMASVRAEGEQHWRQGDFELIGIPYSDKHNSFVVVAGAIDVYGINKLRNLRNTLLISSLLFLSIVAVAGWFYAGRSLRPINRIIDQVKTISGTNLVTRLDEGNKRDEIARLSATFNEMLGRIETTFQLQKAFVANASHELINPLTIITSQVEVTLLRERTPEEYRNTLLSVLEDMRTLNQVSLRLLDLARLNSEELKVNFSHVRIDELIWQCKDEFSEKRPQCKVFFSPELPEEERQLLVMANEYLLKTAIINLMDNACKFSSDKEVFVTMKASGTEVKVQFRDNGIGISESDLPFIFQPFYRSHNAVSIRGHGIGLSLVEKILKLHKATVSVESTPGKGSVFTIVIPTT